MNLQMQPILAVDLVDVAVYGIGAILVVGSWIVNIIKKQADERKAQQRRLSMRSGAATETQAQAGADDIDSIAAKRRAQLRELARQRMQQGGSTTASTSSEPANMTMAERVARARAKARYEQRAQELAKARSEAEEIVVADESYSNEEYKAELARRKAMAKAREEAQRQAELQQQREEARQRAQRQRQQQRQAQQAAAARRDREDLERTRQEEASRKRRKNPKGHVHQLVADAPMTTTRKRRSHALRRTLSGKSLKAAIMVKEVLDAPMALRSPIDEKSL